MNDFIIALIASIATAILGYLAKKIYNYLIYYKKSKYSGIWRDEIYDSNGAIIKRDQYKIKHNKRTNVVTGKIKRTFPENQLHRKWNCTGVLNGNHFILTFWSDDIIKSDGCVYTVFKDDYTYEGYYLRGLGDDIEKIKIRLIKVVNSEE